MIVLKIIAMSETISSEDHVVKDITDSVAFLTAITFSRSTK